jgi:hypothetical protein
MGIGKESSTSAKAADAMEVVKKRTAPQKTFATINIQDLVFAFMVRDAGRLTSNSAIARPLGVGR